MRAQSIHDRAVASRNSYRYCRAIKETQDAQEKKASDRKWDKIYKDIGIKHDEKAQSEPKKP